MGCHGFRLQPLLVGTPSSSTLEVSGRQNLGLYLQHPEVLPRLQPPNPKDAKSSKEGIERSVKPPRVQIYLQTPQRMWSKSHLFNKALTLNLAFPTLVNTIKKERKNSISNTCDFAIGSCWRFYYITVVKNFQVLHTRPHSENDSHQHTGKNLGKKYTTLII